MVRGGKAQSKRNSKRRVNNNEDSDESDEDYVASDAQSDASEDVLVDLAEDSLDDEVDEPVVDDNDDDDDDFKVVEDEEEEEEDDDSDFDKSGRSVSKTVRKPNVVSLRKEEEEEDGDFKVIEDEEEEEEEDDDSDFVKSGRSFSKTVRKPNVVSLSKEDDEDYEANLDDEDEEDEDDEEFTPEEDDSLEEEEEICVSNKRLRSKIDLQPKVKDWGSRKRRKLTAPKKSSRNRRGRIGRARKKPRLDDEFEDEDDIGVRKPVKRVKRKKTISRRKRSCSSKSGIDLVSSESSDFEFTISEEEREQIREASKFCADLAVPQRSLTLPEKKPKQERPSRSKVATSQCTAGPPTNIAIKGKQKVDDQVDPKQVCGICFSEEDKRRVRGKLDCCTHYFCFTCIMEWAKVETRCPLCKQRFKTINKPSRATTGADLRDVVIQVPERDQVYQPTEEEIRGYLDPYENVICTECHLGGDDGLMLLCDLCDSPAHTFCVGLGREVPEGNWYCEGCRPAAIGSGHVEAGPTGRSQTGSNAIDGLDLNVVPAPVPSFNQRVVGNLAFPRFPGEINPFMTGSPTLTGRRMLQSHIQRLRSGSRLNPLVRRPDGANGAIAPPATRVDSFVSLFGERLLQQNGSIPVRNQDGFGDGSGLAPPTMPGGFGFGVGPAHEPVRLIQSSSNGARQEVNFYTAMEQMQSVVQNHLSRLSVDLRLGQDQMKDIVRSATQSILTACGPGRRSDTDRAPPAVFCPHTDRRTVGDTSPMRDLCSGCFHEFTRNVVQSIVNSKLPHNQNNEWLSLGL